jgi:hypothetical protein
MGLEMGSNLLPEKTPTLLKVLARTAESVVDMILAGKIEGLARNKLIRDAVKKFSERLSRAGYKEEQVRQAENMLKGKILEREGVLGGNERPIDIDEALKLNIRARTGKIGKVEAKLQEAKPQEARWKEEGVRKENERLEQSSQEAEVQEKESPLGMWSKAYQNIVDRTQPLKTLHKEAGNEAAINRIIARGGINGRVKAAIMDSAFTINKEGNAIVTGEGFKPIIDDFQKEFKGIGRQEGAEDLKEYM